MAKNNLNQWSLTLLRAILGIIFIYHGYAKLFVPGGFKGTVGFLTAIKIPLPLYASLLISLVEFVGGILLIIGLLSRWASVLLFIEMLVALFKVHLKQGLIISQQAYGYEFIILILAALAVIITNGPGSFSIGKMLFKKKSLH